MAGKHSKQRQHQQQDQCKAGVFYGNDRHDGEDPAGIRHHADDAGGEQRFHGVHIARKAGGHLTGILAHQRTGGQPGQLLGHFRAQRVGHFLTKQHQQALLRRGEHALQREAAKVEQHRHKCQRDARGQAVDDTGQQQRREQRGHYRSCHTEDGAHS